MERTNPEGEVQKEREGEREENEGEVLLSTKSIIEHTI